MKWEKKGQLFIPNAQYDWVKTHGMLPVIDHIKNDLFRVYFSGRDEANISRIGFIEIDLKNPTKTLYLSEKPLIDIGKLGSYDDNGVSPTCIITHEGSCLLYTSPSPRD